MLKGNHGGFVVLEAGRVHVTYGWMFPDVSPPKLIHRKAGEIRNGMFHPAGPKARKLWELQLEKFATGQSQGVLTC